MPKQPNLTPARAVRLIISLVLALSLSWADLSSESNLLPVSISVALTFIYWFCIFEAGVAKREFVLPIVLIGIFFGFLASWLEPLLFSRSADQVIDWERFGIFPIFLILGIVTLIYRLRELNSTHSKGLDKIGRG